MANNVHELRRGTGDAEKITINLGYVDLGHIDLLVQSVAQKALNWVCARLSSRCSVRQVCEFGREGGLARPHPMRRAACAAPAGPAPRPICRGAQTTTLSNSYRHRSRIRFPIVDA